VPEDRAAPDFSTSYWKEFKLKYPRPAVYILVRSTYLIWTSIIAIRVSRWVGSAQQLVLRRGE